MKKPTFEYIPLVIAAIALGLNFVGSALPAVMQDYLDLSWVIAIVMVFMYIGSGHFSKYKAKQDKVNEFLALQERVEKAAASEEEERRQRMLDAVKTREEVVVEEAIDTKEPRIVHPFPLQRFYVGRYKIRKSMTRWLVSGESGLGIIIGENGLGKSSLAWVWLHRDVMDKRINGVLQEPAKVLPSIKVPVTSRPQGIFWWSFDEEENTFAGFLDAALAYVSEGRVKPGRFPLISDRISALMSFLQDSHFLFVIDGLEYQMYGYDQFSIPYTGDRIDKGSDDVYRTLVDFDLSYFLRVMNDRQVKSKILMVSRFMPSDFDNKNIFTVDMPPMRLSEVVDFMKARGVRGTQDQIQVISEPFQFHPMSLRVLASAVLSHHSRPGDITIAAEFAPRQDSVTRYRILPIACDAMTKEQQYLLSWISAFREPIHLKTIEMLNPLGSKQKIRPALKELVSRELLSKLPRAETYFVHALVRQVAYHMLKKKRTVHLSLAKYYSQLHVAAEIRNVEQLLPRVEQFRHLLMAGALQDAKALFQRKLQRRLYNISAFQTCLTLLRTFFKNEKDPSMLVRQTNSTLLTEAKDEAWSLNIVGHMYTKVGHPERAVRLYEWLNVILSTVKAKKDLFVSLGDLARCQFITGELASAEKSMRTRIRIAAEIEDKYSEAIAQAELGHLYSLQMDPDSANNSFDAALRYWKTVNDDEGVAVDALYRAYLSYYMGDMNTALISAREAYGVLEDGKSISRVIQSKLMLAKTILAQPKLTPALVLEADTNLSEALHKTRRANILEWEPELLLGLAQRSKFHGEHESVLRYALKALEVATRGNLRLKEAEVHEYIANVYLGMNKYKKARFHAEAARERAWCNGLPNTFKPVLQRVERMLSRIVV